MSTPSFPATRLRRMRRTGRLRSLVRETRLDLADFVMPLFVCPGEGVARPLEGLPGIAQRSVDALVEEVQTLAALGVSAVLLFGIPEQKDEDASGAYDEDGIVQRALRELRLRFPDLVLATDVCLCEYTSHGHCGVVRGDEIDNDASLELLARTAVSHAEAGADTVCPSDMMDGRVAVLRAVPRGGRVGAVVRRPSRVPARPGECPRGAPRVRARRSRRRRRAAREARAAVPRRGARRARAFRAAGRGLQRLRRVRDAEGGRTRRLARRAPGRARVADRDQARWG